MNRLRSSSETTPESTPIAGLLSGIAERVPFRKGAILGVQGRSSDSLYVLIQGQVLLQRQNPEGEEYALYLLGPGELFGEGALTEPGRWLATARTVTPAAAYVIPVQQLPRFTQICPELGRQLLRLLGENTHRAYQRMDIITATSARERVLGLLRTMAGRHGTLQGNAVWLPLRLSQEELGTMLGLRRETVLRVMAELEAEGLIRREARQGLWIEPTP